MSTAADLPAAGPGLRQRQSGIDPHAQQDKPQAEPGHSRQSSDAPFQSDKSSKTYGRTPDGTGMYNPLRLLWWCVASVRLWLTVTCSLYRTHNP